MAGTDGNISHFHTQTIREHSSSLNSLNMLIVIELSGISAMELLLGPPFFEIYSQGELEKKLKN